MGYRNSSTYVDITPLHNYDKLITYTAARFIHIL